MVFDPAPVRRGSRTGRRRFAGCGILARGDAGGALARDRRAHRRRRPAGRRLLVRGGGEAAGAAALRRRRQRASTMDAVVRWLDEGPEGNDDADIEELLPDDRREDGRERAWQANAEPRGAPAQLGLHDRGDDLAAFADPRVAEETAGADYTPTRLLDGGANTLYLCAPAARAGAAADRCSR